MVDLPEGWIAHDGGPCPVPLDSRPSVMWPNHSVTSDCTARSWTSIGARDGIDFWQGRYPNAIIAYKPEEPQP